MELEKLIQANRKAKREMVELAELEEKIKRFVNPDVKLLAQIAARRKTLELEQLMQAQNEVKKG